MKETIHFYYTNDLHSHFDHWPQVASFMKTKRQESDANNESAWIVDIGDHVDRVHPITEATMGKANVELLNDLQYDVVTLGNNEGLTLSHQNLYHLYDDARFAVVCSNLECTIENNPPWLTSVKQFTSKHGVRVGVIGLTARFNPYYHLLGWNVKAIYETIDAELAAMEGHVEVIVLLSHLGICQDEAIANEYPEIDVIIGGHTHHLLRTGEIVNQTLITAAGKHCYDVGAVAITWDHAQQKIIEKTAETTEISNYPKDLFTAQRLRELQEAAAMILNKKITTEHDMLKVSWSQETTIMRDLSETTRRFADADIGMLNAGLLLDNFPAGDITYDDVHRICPHPINVSRVHLTGVALKEVVHASLAKELMELQLKGFGFRGEVIGRMVFTNLDVHTSYNEEGIEIVDQILFEQKPIEPQAIYTVATADTFTFGRLLPEIAQAEIKELFLPEFIRELLVKTLIERDKNKK